MDYLGNITLTGQVRRTMSNGQGSGVLLQHGCTNHTRTHRAVHHRTIHFTTSPRHYSQQQAFAQSTSLRAPQAKSNK